MLQISVHLLVTKSLKPAHLIKHNAHGQIPFASFMLITQSTAHMHTHTDRCACKHTVSHKTKLSVSIGLSTGGSVCVCVYVVCASIISRVITTQR